jgi:hypothetical protein
MYTSGEHPCDDHGHAQADDGSDYKHLKLIQFFTFTVVDGLVSLSVGNAYFAYCV